MDLWADRDAMTLKIFKYYQKTRPEIVFFCSGLLTFIIALILIIALSNELTDIIHVSSSFLPIRFNSVLSLVAISIAFLLVGSTSKFKGVLGISVCLIPIFLGVMTLIEYGFGINLYIDELFLKSFNESLNPYPGRMIYTACVAFVCLGCGQIFIFLRKDFGFNLNEKLQYFVTFLYMVAFGLAIRAILGYISGFASDQQIENFGLMDPRLAFCIVLLSSAGIYDLIYSKVADFSRENNRFIALGVAGLCAVSAISIWSTLKHESRMQFLSFLNMSAKEYSLEIKEKIEESFVDFISTSQFWQTHSQADIDKNLKYYVDEHDHIKLIISVDFDSNINWQIAAKDVTASYLDAVFKAVAELQSNERFGMGIKEIPKAKFIPAIKTLLYLRLIKNSSTLESRLLIQAVDVAQLILPVSRRYAYEGYEFQVYEDQNKIFESNQTVFGYEYNELLNFNVLDLSWKVRVSPNKNLLWKFRTYIPELILIMGIFVAILSYLLVNLLLQFRQRELVLKEEILRRQEYEAELKQAKLKADEASTFKSQFLANISHEIRTPLNAIIGFVELLIIGESSEEERQRYNLAILRNSEHLNSLINDILDLSKIEAGKLTVEKLKLSLVEVVLDVYLILTQRAKKKGIDFRFEIDNKIPATIISDPTRIRQILVNIIGNSIKFTDYGFVKASFSCQKINGELKLVITVIDTGLGILQENQEKLFKPFSQADEAMARKFGGTGLGLVLSRNLAKAIGGDIELVNSEIGKGTTFRIELNIAIPDQVEWIECFPLPDTKEFQDVFERSSIVDCPDFTGKSILVVDDAIDNRFIIATFLKFTHVRLEVAANGLQAIDKIGNHLFDLVLMDIQMPVLNGYETIKRIRQKNIDIPVIALTAGAMKQERERCLALGFTDYLSKPVTYKKLIDCLQIYIKPNGKIKIVEAGQSI